LVYFADQMSQSRKNRKSIHRRRWLHGEGGIPGRNREKIGNAPVLIQRGDFRREGKIARGFPVILAGERQTAITSGSGRLELAKWIVQADNPLTSRVAVDQDMATSFGRGFVGTPGRVPADWAKGQLTRIVGLSGDEIYRDAGWSVKKLHKEK
jgi:hypothetical protein